MRAHVSLIRTERINQSRSVAHATDLLAGSDTGLEADDHPVTILGIRRVSRVRRRGFDLSWLQARPFWRSR